MSETEEVSKAIQEVSKLGSTGLETAQKAGSFLAKLFQSPLGELSGIVHDKLRFIRWKRMVEMSDEIGEILQARWITETRALPPKIWIPLIENASIEDDDEIKIFWNKLIANAMDPNFSDNINYGYIEMVKSISGKEAFLLKIIYDSLCMDWYLANLSNLHNHTIDKEQLITILNISPDQYVISAHNLMRLQLIAPAVISGWIRMWAHSLTSYKWTDEIYLTALGVKFVEACIK